MASALDGVSKAAIFMMTLGEDGAAQVMKHLGPREVQRIGLAMTVLANVSREQVQETITDFAGFVQDHTSIGIGSDDYIRKVLVDALGPDKANAMVDQILSGGKSKGLESLKWMDARTILDMIRFEHPQIIAIVLAYLDSDQAGQLLSLLPERARPDILARVANIGDVQPQALVELNDILEQQLQTGVGSKTSAMGGIKCAADILNFVDGGHDQSIIELLTEQDPDLATKIQDLMFVFEDIAEVEDRGVQTLLREVSTETLLLALKGTDDAVKNKVFKNMSQRAAEMLRDDLQAKGPVKLSDVETAQKEILTIARRLADEGQIMLGGGGGGEQMI